MIGLVALLSLWAGSAQAQLAPGLPVYSSDGSWDTSPTLSDFQVVPWSLKDLVGTLVVHPSDLFLDSRGDVRVAYFLDRGTKVEAAVSQLRRDGTVTTTSIPLPRDIYREVKLARSSPISS